MSQIGATYSIASRAVSIFSSSNYDGDYLAEELLNLDAPFTLARTTDTAAPSGQVVLDLAGAVEIQAFSFEQHNFGELTIEVGPTGAGPWTTVGVVDMTGRRGYGGRRIVVFVPETPANGEFIRLTPANPDAGATAFEWGIAALWPVVVPVTAIVGLPYSRRIDGRTEVAVLGGGGAQYGVPGERFVQISTSGQAFDDEPDQRAQYQTIANVPDGTVFLWWESEFSVNDAYHVRKTAAVQFSIDGATLENVSGIQLTEVVNG